MTMHPSIASGHPAAHPQPPPVPAGMALEYEAPQTRAARGGVGTRDMTLSILSALFLSVGIGLLLFGVLMGNGWRDDWAGLVAGGASCVTMGASFAGLMIWCRRAGGAR